MNEKQVNFFHSFHRHGVRKLVCECKLDLTIKENMENSDLCFRNCHRVSEHDPLDSLCAGWRGQGPIVDEIFCGQFRQ